MERTGLFLVLLCFYVCAAEGQIIATAGHKVTLKCQVPNNISFIAVNWSRSDLGEKYVLLYRDDKPDVYNQHPSFKKRADLQDRQMKDGDVSVSLDDVTTADNGTYECRVFVEETHSWKLINTTYLSVVPPGSGGGTTEDGGKKDGGKEDGGKEDGGKKDGRKEEEVSRGRYGLIACLSPFVGGVVFLIYRKRQKQVSHQPPVKYQSSFQLNSELPAAVPLVSVVSEHRDRNDLETDGIQQDPTNTPDFILTFGEEPLHHPQQAAGLHQEAVTSPGYEHPGCDGLMQPKGQL